MIISSNLEPRFSGRAIELPQAQDFLDGLADCMVGKLAHQPLGITYEVANNDEITVVEISLLVITAVEFSAFSEHMAVTAKDSEYIDLVLRLRRLSAISSEIDTSYIEIY